MDGLSLRVENHILALILIIAVSVESKAWAILQGVAPTDCVTVRYVMDLWVSTAGTKVAYLVKSPDLEHNQNSYQLYVKELSDKSKSPGVLLITGVDISHIKWLAHDERIAFLDLVGGDKRIQIVNVSTGVTETLLDVGSSVESFDIDAIGGTLAYTVSDGPLRKGEVGVGKDSGKSSHRVSFDYTGAVYRPTQSLYLRHRLPGSVWSSPRLITIENPFTHSVTTHLIDPMYLSLSPNGERLLLNYFAEGIPDKWRTNPFISADVNGLSRIMVLYDVNQGSTKLAFSMTYPDSVPLWSSDSSSFLMNAHSPIGSVWEAEDIKDHWISAADVNLFEVNVESGEISEVFRHVPPLYHHDGPLSWGPDGDVLVRKGWTSVTRIHHFKNEWREAEEMQLPAEDGDRYRNLASNGFDIVGVHETISTPQNVFLFKNRDAQIQLLTDLNPQLKTQTFASIEVVHWISTEGLYIDGLLFFPSDYVIGKRYPLVIQTKGDQGFFACDSGITHEPSFAPQPIATSGMMYLIRTDTPAFKFQQEVDKRPKGYPGGIGEAVQQMDIWDSAVETLDKRGLIDPSKVGIIGFSRTGWQVEFDLVHARTKYAAATAADNIQYSVGEWWLLPWESHAEEQMYGGPPFGPSLKNWQQYSISYNFDKVHTPLLMEEMGYGVHDDVLGAVPDALGSSYEVFQSLSSLGRPVELYYYPEDSHQPDHPRARLESVERNVDWYRFWLQGYEDPDPRKKEQNLRWRTLKELQENDARSNGDGLAPHPSYSSSRR